MQGGIRWQRWALAAAGLLVLVVYRQPIGQALTQLFYGMLVALVAMPLMRLLEPKMKPGLAAALSIAGVGACLVAVVLLLVPALAKQGQLLIGFVPDVADRITEWVRLGEAWLQENGMLVEKGLGPSLIGRAESLIASITPKVVDWFRQTITGVGRWLLAPVFGYYFLRDRRRIGEWLLLLLPVSKRSLTIRLMREIRRETAGYLRGQLLLSTVISALTAVGLLLCGIPAWLLLGALMGILELIPYVGPFLGGAIVLLFSLQAGPGRILWALAVVLVVQQVEGSWLSPKVMSDATRLHPVAVLLCIMLGGSIGGVSGILLAVPAVLCVRAALRVWSMELTGPLQTVKER